MGSFTELVMSFPFRDDTPTHVLAAFASLRVEREGAPALPPPTSQDEWWDPTDPDADMEVPWAHDWAPRLGAGMALHYIQSDTNATLTWSIGEHWVLTCRATLKIDPDGLMSAIAWMGRFASGGVVDSPFLVGTLKHEYDAKPWLIWHTGGDFWGEDLNNESTRNEPTSPAAFARSGRAEIDRLASAVVAPPWHMPEGNIVRRLRLDWMVRSVLPLAARAAQDSGLASQLESWESLATRDPAPEEAVRLGAVLDAAWTQALALPSLPVPVEGFSRVVHALGSDEANRPRAIAESGALLSGQRVAPDEYGGRFGYLVAVGLAELRGQMWSEALGLIGSAIGLGLSALATAPGLPPTWDLDRASLVAYRSMLVTENGWADPFGDALTALRDDSSCGWDAFEEYITETTTQPLPELLASVHADLAAMTTEGRVLVRTDALESLAMITAVSLAARASDVEALTAEARSTAATVLLAARNANET